jgi:hypothetical protein
MFTIGVPQKAVGDEFDVKHLELFHQECVDGKLTIEVYERWHNTLMKLTCPKCNEWCLVICGPATTGRMERTALDGEKRLIASHPDSLNPQKIAVVQRP